MKVCILGDTHFGVRNDNQRFHDYFSTIYSQWLIPYLLENRIKHIIQLGDLFDRRKYINYNTLFQCRRYFFDLLEENRIEIHTLIGNHDIYWKESNKVNSQSLLLSEYDNVYHYDSPTTIRIGSTDIDMIPWINQENAQVVFDFMSKSDSDVCMGHFEIRGFSMYPGMTSDHGLDRSVFSRYKTVLSGHYHSKSSSGNITYVGSPAEYTWQDYGDQKGVWILNDDLTFVPNPHKIFHKIEYDETVTIPAVYECKSKYVKIIVKKKTDLFRFDNFLQGVYSTYPHEVKIVEDVTQDVDFGDDIDEDISLEDTMSIINAYVERSETKDKDKVKSYIQTLYLEVINNQV